MKRNWWTVLYWSLIVVGFALSFARASGYYGIPRIGGILIVIGTLCLSDFTVNKKKNENT
jgi:UDP-N-acetylmuramyl pentapeptide phosphotransferase/UDP-N-acetylglucosamine-1-phosphate transferase